MPLLPQTLIVRLVGSNTLFGNLIASTFGAFMYFSTLTEIPIVQALIAKGMASGPSLALLLAGPSLSLPNMLVIRKVLGTTKTITYVSLVIVYSTIAGLIFGFFF
ncbi:MAG: permease, partial [Candidatus Woesearchaeota archaeon]